MCVSWTMHKFEKAQVKITSNKTVDLAQVTAPSIFSTFPSNVANLFFLLFATTQNQQR